MDDEPLYIARYRIAMALVITGLFTILILSAQLKYLFKALDRTNLRATICNCRRHHVNNLYIPSPLSRMAERYLLQQYLVRTLRRLHMAFRS